VQDILTEDEIGRIVAELNPRTEIGARNQALFILMLDTGMRAGELCKLTLSDLHLEQGYAMVMGKGKKQRPVKIGARAAKALRFYILHWRRPALHPS
jgi:integrase/recombinase XerD